MSFSMAGSVTSPTQPAESNAACRVQRSLQSPTQPAESNAARSEANRRLEHFVSVISVCNHFRKVREVIRRDIDECDPMGQAIPR